MDKIDLDSLARQGKFGRLVGVTQPTIGGLVNKKVLKAGDSYRQWLLAYTAYFREQAAGRGGDGQGDLTKWRTEEAKEKSLKLRNERLLDKGILIARDDIKTLLLEWTTVVKTQVMQSSNNIIEGICSKYKLDHIESELVDGPLRDSLGVAAGNTRKLIKSIGGNST